MTAHNSKGPAPIQVPASDSPLQAGATITGVIVNIDHQSRWVTVHAGLKSEALIPIEQFYNDAGELTINVGDEVQVALDSVEDGFGEV
ncbi:S1 RNA-binding domain-containing protein [Nannocystis sp. ILAH1]|nr:MULTISPECIES: S1 RNA-binding domain-containing protein [unclassified Nannocystis]MCY0992214.1 S1 RNA-binding domain-containing protein [Nannocystis sp. ILAH1]MCY1069196.1 S1 RNA-binding domain-containing protein [Nannocystis sp. RBIL2]